jgi:hypothetical protein
MVKRSRTKSRRFGGALDEPWRRMEEASHNGGCQSLAI